LDSNLLFFRKQLVKVTATERKASPVPPIRWAELVILAAIVFAFAAIEIWADARRPLWFDEIASMVVSTRPSWHEMIRAIPADGNPPLFFLLTRLFIALPINSEIALHLPSILATAVTAIMIYVFVRRNAGSLYAFLAVSAFYASPFGMFAQLEARPYALLLCFTSIAICCWQAVARGRHKRLATVGVAVAMSAAIFSHHYGVIYVGLPLFAAELVRCWRDRKFHPEVIAAMCVAALSLFITFPPTLAGQAGLLKAVKQCPVFLFRPHLASLFLYLQVLPGFVPVVAIAAAIPALIVYCWAIGKDRSGSRSLNVPPIPFEDYSAAIALALILPVMLCVTGAGTRFFWARYAVGTVLGVAILTGLLMSRLRQRAAAVDFLAIAGVFYGLIFAIISICTARLPQQAVGAQRDSFFLSARTGEPIVIADAVVFSPTWWYGDSTLRGEVHYLGDLSYAVKEPDFIAEYSLTLEQQFGAPKIDDYNQFLSGHRDFLLYCVGMPRLEWVKDRLIHEGWKVVLIRSEDSKQLYRVTKPGS
jgi:hypothetical protein